MDEVTLTGDGALRVYLAPPAFLVVTTGEVTLFDGGDAGRVLWRKPDRQGVPPERDAAWREMVRLGEELEVNEAGYPTGNYRKVT